MHTIIKLYYAKTHLSKILQRVDDGESFTITNRGKPIADLIPSSSSSKAKTNDAINTLIQMKNVKLKGTTLKEIINEGRNRHEQ